jgi:hypothetical protein
MPLLKKNGVLASFGGSLARFAAACVSACCRKWYCHTDYTCDQNELGHLSEHPTREDCLRQCGDGVVHYCHTDYKCDTDPTDALASYPSKKACDDSCAQDYAWYCVYTSTDFTKGSACQQGPGPDPGLVRAGPFPDKVTCDGSCESLYYCVLLNGFDGTQPEHYACVVDPTGHLVISGPTAKPLCESSCSTRRRTIWCVDNKRCVISFDGPPPECSFGAFCEEHDTYQECVQYCHPEKWYCVTPGQPCQQLSSPPTPDAVAYSSPAACNDACDDYYCCWVSGDRTKGSYCKLGRCPDGLERSGPHQTQMACEGECHKIYCWSYNDITTPYSTVKVCQEEAPDGCTAAYSCLGQPTLIFGPQEEARAKDEERALQAAGFDTELSKQPNGEWHVLYNCPRDQPPENCDNRICEGTLLPATCVNENVTKGSGPYGKQTDCEPFCNQPTYKWYCENQTCFKCCASGNCASGDTPCPDGMDLYDTPVLCEESCLWQACGAAIPTTATVTLCGFADRLEPLYAECVEGQPGYAAAFNQRVDLTLQLNDLSTLVWRGSLSLPDGYPMHEILLFRGTDEPGGNGCDYAYMSMQWLTESCVRGYWLRNGDGVPLPSYSEGWGFGTLTAPGAKALRTQRGFWNNINVTNVTCRIEFGSTRQGNPLP